MNILFGVNGEGSGHSSRAREVIRHLQSRGHAVRVVSFDRGLSNLSHEFDLTEIYGLRFAYVENRVRYRKTIARNLLRTPAAARSLAKLNRLAAEWKIDLAITDFEPLAARVARHRRLPLISIDNQHALTNCVVEVPRRARHNKDALAAKLVTRFMVPRAQAYLVTAFFEAPVRKENTFVVPPILRREVLKTRVSASDYALVYVTSPSSELAALLKSVRFRFVCYGFGRTGDDASLNFRAPSAENFLRDLAGCACVIANSGFSLISEALHLAKPYLAIPVKHQFEQIFNAHYLLKTGYGAYWEELGKEQIDSFLFNLPVHREALNKYPRQDNAKLFAKLDELIAAAGR